MEKSTLYLCQRMLRKFFFRYSLALFLSAALTACQTAPVKGDAATTTNKSSEQYKAALVRLQLASSYFEVGRLDVAMEEVNNALSFDEDWFEARLLRGMIFTHRQEYPAAETDFRVILAKNPDNPDVLHNYAWLKCQQGQFDQANQFFQQALQNADYRSATNTLATQGLCLQRAGQTRSAITALTESYKRDSQNPLVAYNLALMLYQSGLVADAQVYLRRLNSSEMLNSETLWLGIKVENALGNTLNVQELGQVLRSQFSNSREYSLFERNAFYE